MASVEPCDEEVESSEPVEEVEEVESSAASGGGDSRVGSMSVSMSSLCGSFLGKLEFT